MKQDKNTPSISPVIAMIGCFDTKAEEFNWMYQCLQHHKVTVVTINTGLMGTTSLFPIDWEADKVAAKAGASLEKLREAGDRSAGIAEMGKGAGAILTELLEAGRLDGAISMGGGGGTYVALLAMQVIPFGVPKLCLSTLATKDLSAHIGGKDIVLMPSVVDIAGLNSISKVLIARAADAVCGMVMTRRKEQSSDVLKIAISIFGNTTPCVDKCAALLRAKGYEVFTFHTVGVGGRTMEQLIGEGFFNAVLDITTTEMADDLCGGICSAGPGRLTAAAAMGIPQVVVPGCMDMVNFGAKNTVPQEYKDRQLFSWAPDVTLMRTNPEENTILGKAMAQKLNKSTGQVAVLLPLRGISIVSKEGEPFYNPASDKALFEAIKTNVKPAIPVKELDMDINDEQFAETAVHTLMELFSPNV